MLTIREGRKDDFNFVAESTLEIVRIYFSAPQRLPMIPGGEETYEKMLNDKKHHKVLIAEAEGKKVGLALVAFNYAMHFGGLGAEVQDLFVEPTSRKMGVGRALLKKVAEVAEKRGARGIELGQPPPGSELDEERNLFYKRNGYNLGGFKRANIISKELQSLI